MPQGLGTSQLLTFELSFCICYIEMSSRDQDFTLTMSLMAMCVYSKFSMFGIQLAFCMCRDQLYRIYTMMSQCAGFRGHSGIFSAAELTFICLGGMPRAATTQAQLPVLFWLDSSYSWIHLYKKIKFCPNKIDGNSDVVVSWNRTNAFIFTVLSTPRSNY